MTTTTALLAHLERLVAFDTQNPPRAPAGVDALYAYAEAKLAPAGFRVVERGDLGDGCAWVLFSRGTDERPLVNVHVDTVPADPGWTENPLALRVEGGKATGLGACDIKGALAAFLDAAARTKGSGTLLLTSDEEAGTSRCVRDFLAGREMTVPVIVSEPTRCRAVTAHRGIGTCAGTFTGLAGHASEARALDDSAVHEAVRWAARALEVARPSPPRRGAGEGPAGAWSGVPGEGPSGAWSGVPGEGPGVRGVPAGPSGAGDVRLNIGTIEGGVKANMIASSARVRFGVRPHADPRAVVDALCALAPDPARVTWEPGYFAPPLQETEASHALVGALGLQRGAPVDFFTEAALFAAAGAHAIVVGPGDIAQAHTAGEFVEVHALEHMRAFYERVLA